MSTKSKYLWQAVRYGLLVWATLAWLLVFGNLVIYGVTADSIEQFIEYYQQGPVQRIATECVLAYLSAYYIKQEFLE